MCSFVFTSTPTPEIYTLSLHDALPISAKSWERDRELARERPEIKPMASRAALHATRLRGNSPWRSEEHTSELQSLRHLVCRLLLEKKKKKTTKHQRDTKPTAYR